MQAAAPTTITRQTLRRARSPRVRLHPAHDVASPVSSPGVRITASESGHTVHVSGEIDLDTGASIVEAVGRLRARHAEVPIIVDTCAVTFIDPAGYRALRTALSRVDGTADPLVSHVVGPVVLRLEVVLELVSRSR